MLTAALQGGATMQSIAAGDNPIGNYAKWKIWQSEADHKVGPRPVAGAMTEIIVHPFSVDYGTGASAFYIRTKAQSAALGFGG
ncbi:hypothetical protein NON20_08770 [Synechocystis sp. B12]|nr:hypothetical protein NON20_08770 [Synechocystis sp. B12]